MPEETFITNRLNEFSPARDATASSLVTSDRVGGLDSSHASIR